jgi:hypothetical protein
MSAAVLLLLLEGLVLAQGIPSTTYTEDDDAWAANLGDFAGQIVKRPSSCVPQNTVILTMSNGYHWGMLELQACVFTISAISSAISSLCPAGL